MVDFGGFFGLEGRESLSAANVAPASVLLRQLKFGESDFRARLIQPNQFGRPWIFSDARRIRQLTR
jgi:hypothetical protein